MTVGNIVDGMEQYLQSDGMADYISMIEGLGLVGEIAGLVIGLLVSIIMIGVPVVVAIEICYINFPLIQSGYNSLYSRLKGKPNQIFGLVIRDARRALEESKTTSYGTNVNWIYLKIKCKAIILCVFIVAMVLGPGQILLSFAYNLVKGFITWIF